MRFSCKDCGYETNRKWSYEYHINRKTPCVKKNCKDINKHDDEDMNRNDDDDIKNKRIKELEDKVELLEKQVSVNINITNNIIQINNYDKPNVDHITQEVIVRMYHDSNKEANLMINDAVRRIYRNVPENNSVKLLGGCKSKYALVKKDNETIMLPAQKVLETILSKTSDICGIGLRECGDNGYFIGIRCYELADLFDTLATDDTENDHVNRAKYISFVKSAFLH